MNTRHPPRGRGRPGHRPNRPWSGPPGSSTSRPHRKVGPNRPKSHQANSDSDGGWLENLLLEVLQNSQPNPIYLQDILKSVPFNYDKQAVNHKLYELSNRKVIGKSQQNPPQWFLLQKRMQVQENKYGHPPFAARNQTPRFVQPSNRFERPSVSGNTLAYRSQYQANNLAPPTSFLNQRGPSIQQRPRKFEGFPQGPIKYNPMNKASESKIAVASRPYETLSNIERKVIIKSERASFSDFIKNEETEQSLKETTLTDKKDSDCDEAEDMSDLPPLIECSSSGDESSKNDGVDSEKSAPDSESTAMHIDDDMPEKREDSSSLPDSCTVSDISNKLSFLAKKMLGILLATQRVPIADFVKTFKGQAAKKQLNKVLYDMEKQGLVRRSLENPPMWFLESRGLEVARKLSEFSTAPLAAESKASSRANMQSSDSSSFRNYHEPSGLLGRRPFPAECLKQMEAVSICNNGSLQGNQPLYGDPPHSDPANLLNPPRPKIPRMDSDSSFGDSLANTGKNPVSQLMEYVQANHIKVNFVVTFTGPDHRKRFNTAITVGSQTFPPIEGGSKKDSKTKACEYVLSVIGQSRPSSAASSIEAPNVQPGQMQVAPSIQQAVVPMNIAGSNKNAVSIVNEYAQANGLKIEFVCSSEGPDHKKSFYTTLRIGENLFNPVEGASKKDSKLKAAEAALLVLQSSGEICSSVQSQVSGPQTINSFHDRVAKLVNDKFHSLLMLLPDTVVGRKILAGFVMSRTITTDSGEENDWSVISIGSGNRCVAGDKLSMQGDTVNDCHAEIIARRGLLRFLYKEIQDFRDQPENELNVLMPADQGSMLRIKPGISFHLYISTAPCGDSALFAKSDLRETGPDLTSDEDQGHCPLFENKKQGILRTKVENGEGCIPIDLDANVPTWDGLLRGERLRTMSCSDKIAKWNYVGLQGALLSHFIEPFYMTSLTLGMLYSHGHLTRAVCCRVEKFMKENPAEKPSPLFQVHHPEVAKVSGEDPSRDTGKVKTREYSLNWSVGDERAEVLDGTKGRCEGRFGSINPVSQVSKSSIYAQFKKISTHDYPSYAKAKDAATDYKQAGQNMKKAFETAGCGTWMSKPTEVEDF